MTDASRQALDHLRDASAVTWMIVPLLAITIYVYAVEVERRNWNLVFAGLAFWGMDWLNEIANSLILHFSGRSALWTAPGQSSYLILVGLNVEICFMFSIAGIALAKMLPQDKALRILGMPNRLFFGLCNSIFCVIVEIGLNHWNLLIWEYAFWDVPHIYLIVVFGYLHFNLVAFWVHDMERLSSKIKAVAVIWGIAAVSVLVFGVGYGLL